MLSKNNLRTAFTFAVIIIAVLLLFRLSTYTLLSGSLEVELVLATVATIFFFIGLYINKRNRKKEVQVVAERGPQKIDDLVLSKREYEVLLEVANGLSNRQIADKLFVSESTVKTHVSNILVKLDAKRRTHAIRIAKQQGIL